MTKVVALLPMKGNSERVPNKNLKIFIQINENSLRKYKKTI